MTRALAVLAVGCLVAGSARAARPDTVLALREIASFERATSVSIDPTGGILVADAGRNAIYRLTEEGTIVEAIGGPGTEATRFDGPMGVDATNGLILLVADAGNSRIQRFARDGRFLEWLPIWSDPDRRMEGSEYLQRDVRSADGANGQPTDVVSTDDGRLFVIESISGTIRSWDRNRRVGEVIGAAVGDAVPEQPVALATDGERVFVADSGLPGIVVLDRFGRPSSTFGTGIAQGIRGIAAGGGCIWMVLPDRIAGFTRNGILVRELHLGAGMNVVDLEVRDERFYVLTPGTLFVGVARCGQDP